MELTIENILAEMSIAVEELDRERYQKASEQLDDLLVAEDMGIPAEEWTAASAQAAR